MENDPECTFQPQLSEMSELIMRKHAQMSFLDRVEMWETRKSRNRKNRENRKDVIENYSFTPNIVKKPYNNY